MLAAGVAEQVQLQRPRMDRQQAGLEQGLHHKDQQEGLRHMEVVLRLQMGRRQVAVLDAEEQEIPKDLRQEVGELEAGRVVDHQEPHQMGFQHPEEELLQKGYQHLEEEHRSHLPEEGGRQVQAAGLELDLGAWRKDLLAALMGRFADHKDSDQEEQVELLQRGFLLDQVEGRHILAVEGLEHHNLAEAVRIHLVGNSDASAVVGHS